MTESTTVDTGTAYGRARGTHDARLTEVGPGTPMGETMRRYWHPIAISELLTDDVPLRTRILGEDLIVFRDGQGRAGVVYERCAHRGSSLYYGRIEDDGIRCCYHGWKFDVQGHCLEQACEAGGGLRRDIVRQPWYPVEERYGLVFVYMGPPERKPALPRWDCLEPLEEGERYYTQWSIPGITPATGLEMNFNWLQIFENALDPAHVTWLHTHHSGPQIGGTGTTGFPNSFYDPTLIPETVTYGKTELGAKYHQRYETTGTDGERIQAEWVLENVLPNIIALPEYVDVELDTRHDLMAWFVPSDDTNHRMFFSIRSSDSSRVDRWLHGIKMNGKSFFEMTEDELHRFPSDNEAQGSQGPITLHSEEHLASTDRGIVMLRRLLKKMVDDVEAGRDPIGVSMTDGPAYHVESGNFTVPVESVAAGETVVSGASVAGR